MQKKREKWEGEISAPKAFVKSIIINHPRREESLHTVYLYRTSTVQVLQYRYSGRTMIKVVQVQGGRYRITGM